MFCILIILFILCICLSGVILITSRQVKTINEVLEDIQKGNLDRRIVISRQSLLAETCYKINAIMAQNKERQIEAERGSQRNDKLMTSLSHDIRTPLTSIIGYLDAIYYQYVHGENSARYIDTAKEKAYLLKQYIDELFQWFKINSKDEKAELEVLDIVEETRSVYANWIEVFENRRITYGLDTEKEEIPVMADKVFFERILNNLIKNVLDHSEGTKIWVEISDTAKSAIIKVKDNGSGIPTDELPYLFDRLYKGDASRNCSGSGLGLAITKELVLLQDGQISVQSVENQGTVFLLEFPKS